MSTTELREITIYTAEPEQPTSEPSHIHIPRPSRLKAHQDAELEADLVVHEAA